MVNEESMKTHFHKRFATFVLSLLLIGLGLAFIVWVRHEQGQHRLNRQLIAALKKSDTTRAISLVDEGADPNTRSLSIPAPTLSELVNELLHHSPRANDHSNYSPTALMVACGAWFNGVPDEKIPMDEEPFAHIKVFDPRLTRALLLHGANVNAKDHDGITALDWAVKSCENTEHLNREMNEILTQLLDAGADPDDADNKGDTPMKCAQAHDFRNIENLLRKYSKHP